MIDVLVYIKVVKCAAKDVHYRTNGIAFYALHTLADKIDLSEDEDALKEVYFLGMKHELPPLESEILSLAANAVNALGFGTDTNENLVNRLKEACDNGVYVIEDAKREAGLTAGVHAVLDGISSKLLTLSGLCYRTINNGEGDENSN